MEKIIFECETITPMFLSGADGKTPELRAPSIKAAMRFWWRAMNGHLSIKELKRAEARIFGGSGENEGRSRFNIRVETTKSEKKDTLREKIWNNNENLIKSEFEGIGYLLYSTVMQKNNLKPYFNDLSFSVILTSNSAKILNEVSHIFILFAYLGAIGSRARRGAGNIYINRIIDEKNILENYKIFTSQNKDELKNEIEKLIKQKDSNKLINNTFSNLSNSRIFIFDPQNTYNECFELIGKNYKRFRAKKDPDYKTVKNYLSTGKVTKYIEKCEFGLPLNYRYRSLAGKSALIEGSNRERQRSSSPVLFRIIKTVNNNNEYYYPVLIVFSRELLPVSDSIRIKDTDRSGKKPVNIAINTTSTLINDFISNLPSNTEVKL